MCYLTFYDVMEETGFDYEETYVLLTLTTCPTYTNGFEYFVECGEFKVWLDKIDYRDLISFFIITVELKNEAPSFSEWIN